MKMKIYFMSLFFAAFIILPSSVFAAPKFTPWVGKNTIEEGNGGELHTVEGIDFWLNGQPPRKYKLIGFISDTRHKSGLVGLIRMSGQEEAIAKEAAKVQGNAVIAISTENEVVGYTSNANVSTTYNQNSSHSSGWGTSHAIEKNHAKYAVIQYVTESTIETKAQNENLIGTVDQNAGSTINP